jgi:hypothetical protein
LRESPGILSVAGLVSDDTRVQSSGKGENYVLLILDSKDPTVRLSPSSVDGSRSRRAKQFACNKENEGI